jgi:hypothetical protein
MKSRRLAYFSAELLPEQRLDIRLVIDNQHPYGHGRCRSIRHQTWAFGGMAMFPPDWPGPDVPVASGFGC